VSKPDDDHAAELISVVVPCFNESEVLPEFSRRLHAVLAQLDMRYEVIFVDDGSRDTTLQVMRDLRGSFPDIGIVELSRNFGKEAAMSAGIELARGDAVIVIDADLQDPPEEIPRLIEGWRDGYDVVYATRDKRSGETAVKRWTAHMFYRLMARIGDVPIPPDTGDFRILSRTAVDALRQLPERYRFMKGLFSWIGYAQKSVRFEREARQAGTTKWNYWRLWNFALDGITSFTTVPLRLATYLGLVVAGIAFVYGAFMIMRTLLFGNPVAGYPSLMVVILLLGGVQLVTIGIIGEYLGRLYMESKQRPLYLVRRFEEPRAGSPRTGSSPSDV